MKLHDIDKYLPTRLYVQKAKSRIPVKMFQKPTSCYILF